MTTTEFYCTVREFRTRFVKAGNTYHIMSAQVSFRVTRKEMLHQLYKAPFHAAVRGQQFTRTSGSLIVITSVTF